MICSQHPVHLPARGQHHVGASCAAVGPKALPDASQRTFPDRLASGLYCKIFRAVRRRTSHPRRHHRTVRGATQHLLRRDKPAGATGHPGGNSG